MSRIQTQTDPSRFGPQRVGVPDASVNPAAIAGSGIAAGLASAGQDIGQALVAAQLRQQQATRARHSAQWHAQTIVKLAEAEDAAGQADPAEAMSVYSAALTELQQSATAIDDPAVRDFALNELTKLGGVGQIRVNRDAARRETSAYLSALDADADALAADVAAGRRLPSEVRAAFDALIETDGERRAPISDDQAAAARRAFAERIIREEYHLLMRSSPQMAAELMDDESAAVLDADERARRREAATLLNDRAVDDRRRDTLDAIRQNFDDLLAGDPLTLSAAMIDNELSWLEGLGLSADERNAEHLDLLDNHLATAALRGDAERFELIASAMPGTGEATELIERQRRVLGQSEIKVSDDAVFDEARVRALQQALELMDNAAVTGGAARIDDITVELPSGAVKTISRNDLVETATAIGMQEIAERYGESPEQVIPAQVRFLSNNDITFTPYKRILAAGFGVIAGDVGNLLANGIQGELPANFRDGYALWKHMGAVDPRRRNLHVDSAQVRSFYEMVELAEKYIAPDLDAAVMMTIRGFNQPTPFGDPLSGSIDRKTFDKYLARAADDGTWGGSDTRNVTEVSRKLEQIARFYMQTIGLNMETAVEEAQQRISQTHKVINGWSIDVGDRTLPEDIDAVANTLIDRYMRLRGKDEGVEKDDLSLIPGETENTWIIATMAPMPGPVDSWNQTPANRPNSPYGFFTTDMLMDVSEQVRADQRELAMREAVFNADNAQRKRVRRSRNMLRTRASQMGMPGGFGRDSMLALPPLPEDEDEGGGE